MELFRIYLAEDNKKSMQSSHFHSTYEVYFLLEGRRDFFIKDTTYEIAPGQIVFISPKVIHKSMTRNSLIQRRYVLMIPKEFVNSLALNYEENLFECFQGATPVLTIKDSQFEYIYGLFKRINDEFEKNGSHQNFILSILVTELLYYLNQYYGESVPMTVDEEKSVSKQVVQYMQKHYKEAITVNGLSERFFLSSFQLCRTFKQETGFTVMEYLTYVRLREAMNLLDTQDMLVTDIAFAVGFNNLNHFIRTFKKHLNITPKQYQLNRR